MPFAVDGGTDVLACALAESARKYLPQSLIVVNKAGASGGVGWSELANAKPDGYKLAIITVELTMIPHMGLTKITADDLMPIRPRRAVRADAPYQTIEEWLAAACKSAGSLQVGNAGPGSLGHHAAAALEDKTRVQLNHVPYRGANPAVLDLLGGHIDAAASPRSRNRYCSNSCRTRRAGEIASSCSALALYLSGATNRANA